MRLGLIIPKPSDGTSYYRAAGPLKHLAKFWSGLQLIPMPQDADPDWSHFYNIDALFIQRPNTNHGLAWARMAKRMRVPVWLDYDDHSAAHQPNHPAYWAFHGENKETLYELIREASVISVSTQPIADWLQTVAPHVPAVVIPNAVDETLGDPHPGRDLDPKFLLWRGSWSHSEDVYLARDLMTRDDIRMHYIGYIPPWVRSGPDLITPWLPVTQFLDNLAKTPAGAAVVPLLDNTFNRAKSNCVWLETTWAGLATAHVTDGATSLPEFCKPGILSLPSLATSTPESLSEAREDSLAFILDNLTLAKVNPLRAELLQNL